MDQLLSGRAQRLLKLLIEQYIESGQPVGSKLLAQHSGMELSAATIRNVLADLEQQGLLASPHTSAGRVPTDLGYRLFVDSLVSVKPLEDKLLSQLQRQIRLESNSQNLLSSASNMLSELTSLTSIVMLPKRDCIALRQIEFVPLSEKRVLAIMVMSDAEVENRIIHTSRNFSETELRQAANLLNRLLVGRDIQTVRDNILGELESMRKEVNEFLQAAVEMASQMFSTDGSPARDDLVVSGESKLLHMDSLADIGKARRLLDAFGHKRDILDLLDRCMSSERMQVFIGAETNNPEFEQCSLISAPYSMDGKVVGVLGIIGPTRMAYDRVIPMVDVTAKLLGAALQFKK
ncbi:MAG: heat-inducible transcriptional repressor HrcA [Gammaproteobacteria bacterium]|nr:heat-inducible transcriptional repressor HrcA [Gammaproteobacteria bacterium]